ncbi:zeta toxin family protein [Nocardiopsis oceani]
MGGDRREGDRRAGTGPEARGDLADQEWLRGYREHFADAYAQERVRGAVRRVRILYQQLAAAAEDGSLEEAEYEQGARFYLRVERRAHLLGPRGRRTVTEEYPGLADELAKLVRPRGDRSLTPREHALVSARRRIALTPPRPSGRQTGRPDGRIPGERPQAVFLAGQPGAGKTSLLETVRSVVGAGTTAVYHRDDNAEAHPAYAEIFEDDPFSALTEAARHLAPDLERRCLEHVRAGPHDVVVVDPLGDPGDAEDLLGGFTGAGYRVSVTFVAAHHSDSLLGIADRFQSGLDHEGIGRWADAGEHQRIYDALPEVAHHVESGGLADSVYVVDRRGGLLHENHLSASGSSGASPGARETLRAHRAGPISEEEAAHFRDRLAYVRKRSPGVG